jgi:copper(I)-binding protein
MNKSIVRVLILLVALVMVAASCGSDDNGSIEVQDARYRLSRSDLGAGYLSVTNTTGDDVTLEAASADGVGRIEFHESIAADDGTMSMQARPDGFVVPAGETITLQPGGKHLMIFDPEGTDDLTISLDFGDETIEILAPYDAEASAAAMSDTSMGDMDDDAMEDSDS